MDGTELRPLKIMAGAMISGPVLFLAVTFYLRGEGSAFRDAPTGDTLTWVSLLFGVVLIATSFLLPRPKGRDVTKIRAHFLRRLAFVEGGALFGTVAYLLEGEHPALGVAIVCIAVMIALHFPTRERVTQLLGDASE